MHLIARSVVDLDPRAEPGREFAVVIDPAVPPAAATDRPLEVAMVVPALVDASVRFRGYRESLADAPFGAAAHVADLHGRFGVGACRESGNSWEALRHVVDVLGVRHVATSGPVLVDGEPGHEIERPVVGADGALRAVASAELEGATWIGLGPTLPPELVRAVATEATARGLRVAARPGRTGLGELVAAGVRAVHGAHALLDGPPLDDPAEAALAWADVDPDRRAAEVGEALVGHGVALVPEYVAARRRVLLDEAIDARDLELLVPILPAARHLLEMRRAGGQAIGRRQLADHGAMRSLRRRERARARDGLDRLGAFVAALAAGGVRLWPGSAAPSIGVVPGAALWEELEALMVAGVEPIELLWSASTGALDLLGLDGIEPGVLGTGGAVALGADPRESPGDALRGVAPVRLAAAQASLRRAG